MTRQCVTYHTLFRHFFRKPKPSGSLVNEIIFIVLVLQSYNRAHRNFAEAIVLALSNMAPLGKYLKTDVVSKYGYFIGKSLVKRVCCVIFTHFRGRSDLRCLLDSSVQVPWNFLRKRV